MKRSLRLAALLLAALTVAPSGGAALELEQGRIRLVLHEGIGRFSLYYRSNDGENPYVPLFVDRDPRTSGLSVLVGNKILRLGEGGGFREQTEQTAEGATFTWQSGQLSVTEAFRLSASQPDAVTIEISVTNLSGSALNVGLRLCLDTYLGEDQVGHFRTDRQSEINREATLLPADGASYWASPGPAADGQAGLFCLTSGPRVTVPDRVVFANWKRLSEAPWPYETSQTRNFSLVPYSINDSAVCQYYDPALLPAKATRKIVVVLGHMSGLTAALAGPAAPVAAAPAAPASAPVPAAPAAPAPATAEATAAPAEPRTLQEEIALLDSLLARLRQALSASGADLEQEVRLIQETLSGIKSRSTKY